MIGIGATGRSNLLGYICSRPEVVDAYLPQSSASVCCLFFDINSLPALTTSYLYRGMLNTLEQQLTHLSAEEREAVTTLLRTPINYDDTFAVFTLLNNLHDLIIRQYGYTVVWMGCSTVLGRPAAI